MVVDSWTIRPPNGPEFAAPRLFYNVHVMAFLNSGVLSPSVASQVYPLTPGVPIYIVVSPNYVCFPCGKAMVHAEKI